MPVDASPIRPCQDRVAGELAAIVADATDFNARTDVSQKTNREFVCYCFFDMFPKCDAIRLKLPEGSRWLDVQHIAVKLDGP